MKPGARLASLVISDLPAPIPVTGAAREAISLNKVIYTAPAGMAPLRAGIRAM